MTDGGAASVVERVYRDHRARMLAALVRLFGDFELAEDALQDACALALRRWPEGVPDAGFVLHPVLLDASRVERLRGRLQILLCIHKSRIQTQRCGKFSARLH